MTDRVKTLSAVSFIFLVVLFITAAMGIDNVLSAFVDEHATAMLIIALFLASTLLYAAISWLGRRPMEWW